MNTIEILARLERVKFTTEQARTITAIFEEHHAQLATKDDIKMIREDLKSMATKDELKVMREDFKHMVTKDELNASIAKAKYDLVRWIVGAVIANGLIATLLKFFA
ncbi:MAG: hypothetical protein GDA51_02740 [Ekhidna sp.]|nr:hypothetical protein [Ekhidna sp.]MBC6410442.1 hypothetical protein [Ekhidna sp.]MBC6425390.1 hypothetical protein [Ekhidna sp.]